MKALAKKMMSATQLARNLASSIDQVRLSGQVIEITKGNQTIAQLIPAPHKGFPVSQLKDFFQKLSHLGNKDNPQMSDDLKKIRNSATLSSSPWE